MATGREIPLKLRGSESEDAPPSGDQLWIPRFTDSARAGFDSSLSFLDAEDNELTQRDALARIGAVAKLHLA